MPINRPTTFDSRWMPDLPLEPGMSHALFQLRERGKTQEAPSRLPAVCFLGDSSKRLPQNKFISFRSTIQNATKPMRWKRNALPPRCIPIGSSLTAIVSKKKYLTSLKQGQAKLLLIEDHGSTRTRLADIVLNQTATRDNSPATHQHGGSLSLGGPEFVLLDGFMNDPNPPPRPLKQSSRKHGKSWCPSERETRKTGLLKHCNPFLIWKKNASL